MLTIAVLTCSVLFQFLAVLYALRLIKLTGKAVSWILISLALFLMMIRRAIPLYYLIFTKLPYPSNLISEFIGLLLSIFMLLGIMGIKQIFIARQKAEEEGKRSAKFINYLSKYANDFIILLDENFRFIEVNERVKDFYGYSHEELIGMHASQLRASETKEEFVNQIKVAQLSGKALYETIHQRKDGSTFPVEISLRAIQSEGKRFYQAVIRDITERKKAEKVLQESERKYRELVEYANSIILHWTNDGKITFLNEFGQRFFGYSAEEIIGRHVIGTIVPTIDSVGHDLIHLMDQICDDPIAFEKNINENILRNGERVWIAWTNRIVRNEQGEITEIMSIGTDITELKRAEEEIRELNTSLEKRVAERTAELVIAKEQAESADRLKSAFLASMSHELRTPLNSIIGFTGMVLQGLAGPLNEEQKKQLGMVRGSARHLLDLINDILDISKIEVGQLNLMSGIFDLRKSIEKVVQIISPLAEKKNLRLSSKIGDNISEIRGDQRRVEQIIINLLSNAVKFTDRGEIKLDCHADDESITLSVTDTGIGIKPENLHIIFDAFRQVDSGITRVQEGTGLGLNITKKLVEMMGGSIHVASKLEEGSAFTVTLPKI
ncbi:MAG: PAS domain S-box protein [Smithella sp.]